MTRFFARVLTALALIFTFGNTIAFGAGPLHIGGAWSTETGNQDRRPFEWSETVKYLDNDRKMFTRILAALPSKKVRSVKYLQFERQHPTRWITLAEDVDGSETAIDVSDASMLRADDVLVIPGTGERVLVVSISGNTITVTRGYQGSTASAAALSGDFIYLLFQRQAEGDTSPGYMTTDYSTVFNYAQIFKRVFGFTRTELKEMVRGPKEWAEQRRLADDLITEDIEHALTWGKKQLLVSGGKVFRTTGGLDEFTVTNRVDLEGGLGYGDIGWIGNQSTRFTPGKKVWMCSRDVRQQINGCGYPMVTLQASENKLGMTITKVDTGFGEFMLVTHHGLENGYGDRLHIFDTSHAAIAEFDPVHLEENIQENDRDGVKHQLIGELGLWVDTELAHFIATGAAPINT